MSARVALIGAGIAGLACARRLRAAGLSPVVFDKGRGPGGRLSTRRVDGLFFDHAAPGFDTGPPPFARLVDRLAADGVVAPWDGAALVGASTHTAVPAMNALPRALADGLDLRCATRIARVERRNGGWVLDDDTGATCGPFDAVAVAVPAPQAVGLLEAVPPLAGSAAEAGMEARWTVMLAFDRPLAGAVDRLARTAPEVAVAIRNAAKPGRPPGPDTWVLHATAGWTADNLERPADAVAADIAAAFLRALGEPSAAPVYRQAHRWLYALAVRPLGVPMLLDAERRIGACGDWCAGPRVGDAFASGEALAAALLNTLAGEGAP